MTQAPETRGQQVARISQTLLSDPFSEATRRQQTNLLLSTLKAHVRLKRFRAGLEIVVPLGLASLAIYSSMVFAVSSLRH